MSKHWNRNENKLHEKNNRRDHNMRNLTFHNHKGEERRYEYNNTNHYDASYEESGNGSTERNVTFESPTNCIGNSSTQFILRVVLVL